MILQLVFRGVRFPAVVTHVRTLVSVLGPYVTFQIHLLRERSAAIATNKSALASVYFFVSFEGAAIRERLLTDVARVGLVSSVRFHVDLYLSWGGKSSGANFAREGFFSSVGADMYRQLVALVKSQATLVTLMLFVFGVSAYVFGEVSGFDKSFTANITNVRPNTGVDFHVAAQGVNRFHLLLAGSALEYFICQGLLRI
jgi:hypothetical protein